MKPKPDTCDICRKIGVKLVLLAVSNGPKLPQETWVCNECYERLYDDVIREWKDEK